MIEDPISPTRSLDTGEPQLAPPVWNESADTPADGAEPAKAVQERLEVARAHSKTWVVTRRRSFSLVLEKRRQRAARAILGTILKSSVAERNLSSVAGQLVANNQRLLRSTSLDIRTALRSEVTFPEVNIGGDPAEEVPRVYPAARAYLAASNFTYDEPSFIEFIAAAQENAYLEISEIWLLKQMLQLVLLERFAEKSAKVPKANGAVKAEAVSAEAVAADITSLMESIRKLSDSD